MKNYSKQRFYKTSRKFFVFFLFCIALWLPCAAQTDSGTVTVVYDGDTIKVLLANGEEEKIRLIGIDAPETNSEDKKNRLNAFYSKRFVFKSLYKKQVSIEYDWEKRDKYGRLLAYIWTEDGTLFNEYVIQRGFAAAYTRFPYKAEYRKRFLDAEQYAKARENGIWKKEPFPLVSKQEAPAHMGMLVSCEFVCATIRDKGNLLLLESKEGDFGATVYKKYQHLFPEMNSLIGKKVILSGLLEAYRGQPQIMLFFPSQIKK